MLSVPIGNSKKKLVQNQNLFKKIRLQSVAIRHPHATDRWQYFDCGRARTLIILIAARAWELAIAARSHGLSV